MAPPLTAASYVAHDSGTKRRSCLHCVCRHGCAARTWQVAQRQGLVHAGVHGADDVSGGCTAATAFVMNLYSTQGITQSSEQDTGGKIVGQMNVP